MKYLILILSFVLFGCLQQEAASSGGIVQTQLPEEKPKREEIEIKHIPLSWELKVSDGQVSQNAKPERKKWTEACLKNVNENYDVLFSAKDIKTLIPNTDKFSKDQNSIIFCQLISSVAKYESSWRPSLQVKDVNGRTEPKYMATGLLQMNAADDQRNYRTGTSYSFQELQNPEINIEVGIKIMVTLIKLRGKITYAKGEKSPVLRYFFATLLTDTSLGKKVLSDFRQHYDRITRI